MVVINPTKIFAFNPMTLALSIGGFRCMEAHGEEVHVAINLYIVSRHNT